jgi:hypothetical protein
MTRHATTILLLTLTAACTKDIEDETGDGCGIYPSREASSPEIAMGPETLDTRDDDALNQASFESQSPLAAPRLVPMRRGPCGVVGLAYRRTGSDGSRELAYVELLDAAGSGPGAPETVEDGDPGLDLSLFYDSECSPVILRGDGGDWTQYTTDGSTWTSEPAGLDLSAFDGAGSSVRVHGADATGDGTFHLLGHSLEVLVHGSRDAAPGSTWKFEAFPQPPATEVDQYRVDEDGDIHALYTKTEYPCDPCNLTLYYGELEAGEWSTVIVQDSEWGPPLDEYSWTPWMELVGTGRPIVAAHFVHRVVTGSFRDTRLRVYAMEEGAFCGETVVTTCDGYQGSDGDEFTGALPVARVDGGGRVHVTFLDQSIWHDSDGYMNEIRGQLRHAVRGSDGWTVATLTDQPGQTESPDPLVGYGAPLLALSGDTVVVAAAQHTWSTDSIYNSTDVPVTYELHVLAASH